MDRPRRDGPQSPLCLVGEAALNAGGPPPLTLRTFVTRVSARWQALSPVPKVHPCTYPRPSVRPYSVFTGADSESVSSAGPARGAWASVFAQMPKRRLVHGFVFVSDARSPTIDATQGTFLSLGKKTSLQFLTNWLMIIKGILGQRSASCFCNSQRLNGLRFLQKLQASPHY